MADADTFIMKSAVFTPTGLSAQTIGAIDDVQVEDGGVVVAHGAGNNFCVLAHFMDDAEATITIRTRDQALIADADLLKGVVGALVITYQKRKAGKGGVSGQDRTITAGQAMVGPVNASLPRADRGEATFVFHCSDPLGLAALAHGGPA